MDESNKKGPNPYAIERYQSLPPLLRFDSLAKRALLQISENSVSFHISALTAFFKHSKKDIRWEAANALGKIGPATKEVVTSLIETLQDEDEYVRFYAACALGNIGPAATEAVPALIKLVQDESQLVRVGGDLVLKKLGPAVKEVIPALIKELKGEDMNIRWHAALALSYIGNAATEAVPALIEALQDEDENVRNMAKSALLKIDPEFPGPEALTNKEVIEKNIKEEWPAESIPTLIETLKDENKDVRSNAAEALGRIGPTAISALNKALADKNPLTQIGAHLALALIKLKRRNPETFGSMSS